MGRARSAIGGRTGARSPGAGPPARPSDVFAQLSHLAGNRAVGRMLARRTPSDAPPIKDRSQIDRIAKLPSLKPEDRCRMYAETAGTQWVHINPTAVRTSPSYEDGLNLDDLHDPEVPATTGWIDQRGRFSGGAPPDEVKGIAIVVNSGSPSFEDPDYMVAAIRHEMVHVRLFRLTLKHATEWKRGTSGLTFSQYVDRHVGGIDGALVKDRYFGGHQDEAIAYLDGFLTAFSYAATEQPQAGRRAWISHLQGFTEAYQTAWLNSGRLPKDLRRVPEQNLAFKTSANAVVPEAERLVKDFCDAAGEARRRNLAAWVRHLYKSKGMHDAALKMIYRVATKGATMPEPKRS